MYDDISLSSLSLFVHRAKEITILTLVSTITRQNLQIGVKIIFDVEISISSFWLIFCFLTLPFHELIDFNSPAHQVFRQKYSDEMKFKNK